jgi:hypothetical protein
MKDTGVQIVCSNFSGVLPLVARVSAIFSNSGAMCLLNHNHRKRLELDSTVLIQSVV